MKLGVLCFKNTYEILEIAEMIFKDMYKRHGNLIVKNAFKDFVCVEDMKFGNPNKFYIEENKC